MSLGDQATRVQGRNVLKKEPMGKDISETDVFSFNEEFHNKLYKIKIATVSAQKDSEPEKIETRHKVSQDIACCSRCVDHALSDMPKRSAIIAVYCVSCCA